jgi:hypothetical protein
MRLLVASAFFLGSCNSRPAAPQSSPAKGIQACHTVALPGRAEHRRVGGDWHVPDIEPAVRDIVRANRSVLAVHGVSGDSTCIPLGWIDSVESFELSHQRRLLDFDHIGHLDTGHFVVDRRSGQAIETGTWPAVSGSGTMLIATPPEPDDDDDDGGGQLGIWRVLPDRIATLATVALPDAQLWQVERWSGEACAELSAVAQEDYWQIRVANPDEDDAADDLARLPRLHFRVRPVDGRWRIEPSRAARPCEEDG